MDENELIFNYKEYVLLFYHVISKTVLFVICYNHSKASIAYKDQYKSKKVTLKCIFKKSNLVKYKNVSLFFNVERIWLFSKLEI